MNFLATEKNMKKTKEKNQNFEILVEQGVDFKIAKIGLQLKLSGNLKVVKPSRNTANITAENIDQMVMALMGLGFVIISKQSSAKTKNGIKKFLVSCFNKQLKTF